MWFDKKIEKIKRVTFLLAL